MGVVNPACADGMVAGGGAAHVVVQFGQTDQFGIGRRGSYVRGHLVEDGWRTNTNNLQNGYCPGPWHATSMDFHNSGPAVAYIERDLPDDGSEVLVKYANCYSSGCAAKLFIGGNVVDAIRQQHTARTVVYSYSPGQALRIDESEGTCVGSIFYVAYR